MFAACPKEVLPNADIGHEIILGPTHITQTDVWVPWGDTLSLFQKTRGLGDWVSGIWCRDEVHN